MKFRRLALVFSVFAGVAHAQSPAPSPGTPPAEAPSPPSAQPDAPPPPPPPPPAADVSIAGTRVTQTSGSAHIVKERQLQRFSRDDPNALLQTVPGVYVRGEDGVGLRPNIGMRGASSDRSKKLTLMEDGVLFGPAPYSAPAAYYFPLLARMQTVKVIKGPGSIPFGPHTVGGAIDLVTHETPSSRKGFVDIGGGQFGWKKAHVGFGGGGDDFAMLLEGVHLESSGFKDLDGGGDTGFARNEWMAKARYLPVPSSPQGHEIEMKLGYADERSNETYLGLTDRDFRETPYRRYGASRQDRMENHRTSIQLSHRFRPHPDMEVVTTAYRNDFARTWRKVNGFRGASIADVLATPDRPDHAVFYGVLTGAVDSSAAGESIMIGPNQRVFVSEGVQSVGKWRGKTGPLSHRLEYGMRIHYDSIDRRHSQDGFNMVGGELVPDGRPTEVTSDEFASTHALALHLMDAVTWGRLTVTAGTRVESIFTHFTDRLNHTHAGGTQQVFVPGAGAFVALPYAMGLLAGVHRGFSPVPPGPTQAKPETSTNYEAGMRFAPRDLRFEVIGFWNAYSNLTNLCTFSTGCQDANIDRQSDAGRARVRGVEVYGESEKSIGRGFVMPARLSYTYTDAVFQTAFTSSDPIFGEVKPGDRLPYVPTHQLSMSVGLERTAGGVNVGATYSSRMRERPGQGTPAPVDVTDTIFLLDASGTLRLTGQLRLYLNVRNVTDSTYLASRRPFGARPGAPRWTQAGIRWAF